MLIGYNAFLTLSAQTHHMMYSSILLSHLFSFPVNRLREFCFSSWINSAVDDHLLYSHYQKIYFVWMIYIKENLHTNKLAGAKVKGKFRHYWAALGDIRRH